MAVPNTATIELTFKRERSFRIQLDSLPTTLWTPPNKVLTMQVSYFDTDELNEVCNTIRLNSDIESVIVKQTHTPI